MVQTSAQDPSKSFCSSIVGRSVLISSKRAFPFYLYNDGGGGAWAAYVFNYHIAALINSNCRPGWTVLCPVAYGLKLIIIYDMCMMWGYSVGIFYCFVLEHVEVDAKKKAICQCPLSNSKAENFLFHSEEERKNVQNLFICGPLG